MLVGFPGRRDPISEVVLSQSLEFLLGLHVAVGIDRVPTDMLETGKAWFVDARTALSASVRREVDRLGEARHGSLAIMTLSDLALASPDPARMIAGLEAAPPEDVWLGLLDWPAYLDRSDEVREALLAARPGNLDALRRVAAAQEGETAGLVVLDFVRYFREPARAKHMLVELARGWYEDAWRDRWPALEPVLERSVRFAFELSAGLPVPEMFERLTNGIEFRLEPGIDRIVFAPSLLLRPRAYHARCERDFLVAFPAPDEAVAANPEEGRRARAVKVARALADDTRLRALRFLAERPATLQEMADAVGVRKSTMHHHLAAMRGAGLLLISMHDKRYRLRTAAIGEAHSALADYLAPAQTRTRRRGSRS